MMRLRTHPTHADYAIQALSLGQNVTTRFIDMSDARVIASAHLAPWNNNYQPANAHVCYLEETNAIVLVKHVEPPTTQLSATSPVPAQIDRGNAELKRARDAFDAGRIVSFSAPDPLQIFTDSSWSPIIDLQVATLIRRYTQHLDQLERVHKIERILEPSQSFSMVYLAVNKLQVQLRG